MTHEQWRRAKPHLTQAISLGPAERERLFRSVFQDEAGLCDELLKALADCGVASMRVLGRPSESIGAGSEEADGAFLAPGDMCGHYRIVRLLGTGGMGQVYLAEDVDLGTPAALKLVSNTLLASSEARARLRREAAKAAQLRYHAHIATVLQFMELQLKGQNVAVLAMEYVSGGNAGELLAEGGRIAVNRALDWAIQIARAIEFAHEKGILHCDIKPANVQVERSAAGEHVKVLDFGIARALFERTPSEGVAGTPAYMAPEQLTSNECGPAADIYSLGVTLFELVTGRQPYQSDDPLQMLVQAIAEPAPRASDIVSGLPRGLDAALQRAMAKAPEARYPSMAAFRKEMEALVPTPRGSKLLVYSAALASSLIGITLLGFVTSQALDQGLGLRTEFRVSTVPTWFVWGGRSLVAPVVVSLLLLVALLCVTSAVRLAKSWSKTAPLLAPWTMRANSVVHAFSSFPTSSLAQALLLVHVVVLGALTYVFSPLLTGFMNFMTGNGPIDSLRPSNRPMHELFGYSVTLELLVFCIAWFRLLRLQSIRGERDAAMYVAAGVAAMCLSAALFTARFKIISHNEHERVMLGSETCYLIEERPPNGLLFCPGTSPRNVLVDLDRLERTGRLENIFSPLDPS